MKKLICCLALLIGSASCFAEDAPQPPRGNRGNFDPEAFRQRMLERIKENLGSSDDEWKALQPKIEAVQKAQTASRGGFGAMFRNRRPGQGGGDTAAPAPAQPEKEKTDLEKKAEDLRTLADKKDADGKEVKDKLAAYREARDKSKADLKKAQDELKELLTPRQEAQLVLMGLLD